ncbi:DUF3866 family protein [Armatimonas sp.]|uniref:DUF3866 family protein n=1 Tax=Armatimonas sp. TaxID=1872638 RepID=UPI003752956F
MPRLDCLVATITSIERVTAAALWGRAQVVGEQTERKIVAYPALTGPLSMGDEVQLNVTATNLSLGTGGVDFVMGSPLPPRGYPLGGGNSGGDEHIIKLRYTPLQHAVAVAEQSAAWDDTGAALEGVRVVACLLHSQVALVAAAAKAARPDVRIAYVMTDSAALPLGFSTLVGQLRAVGLLDSTLTCGQAFGAERECVTLPSALIAASALEKATLIIVAPGPGNAGTGTRYGFSGIEQAWVLQVAAALGGRAICCLRASEADPRARHRGVSHHSRTVLELCGARPLAGWPQGTPLPDNIAAELILTDPEPGLLLLEKNKIRVTSMGRSAEQDPLFFRVSAASGCV